MKVTIANHGIYPLQVGGMERHTFNLAKSLQDFGMQVEVLVPGCEKPSSVTFPFHVKFLPWGRQPVWLWANYEFSKRVHEHIQQDRPDIFFAQGLTAWTSLKKTTVPIIFHPHGLEMYGAHLSQLEYLRLAPFRMVARYHAKHSQRVISLGGKLTDILSEKVGVPREKIVEIPNAIESKEFYVETAEPRIPNSFLFVGRLAFNKGIDFLPAIMKRLAGEEFSLTIVGQGPELKKVMQLCNSDRRVTYKGEATSDELRHLYQTHETLLFTSRFEGMPTVILEAMASGMLVVATKIGAVEAILDESMAQLAEPSAESIVMNMQRTLRLSKTEKENQQKSLKQRLYDRFTWPKVLPAYIELFQELHKT